MDYRCERVAVRARAGYPDVDLRRAVERLH